MIFSVSQAATRSAQRSPACSIPTCSTAFCRLWLLPDRAETLERAWEEAWDAPDDRTGLFPRIGGTIGAPFLALAPKDGEPWRPLLIVQGASESGGRRMLTSAVKFTCDEVDADDLLDGLGHDVAASTAILDGARFPWVSPGGTFTYLPCYGKEGDPRSSDHVLDGGYFDNAGAETLREMTRAIRSSSWRRYGKGLDIVFVLIGYSNHDPTKPPPLPATGLKAWIPDRIGSLVPNDVFAPVLGLYNGMDAHEAHLAREMKLAGQTVVVDPDPYRSRLTGDDPYAALVLCPGEVKLDRRPDDLLRPAHGLDAVGRSQALHRELGDPRLGRLRSGQEPRRHRLYRRQAQALTKENRRQTANSRSALPCAILSRSPSLTGSRSRKARPSAID